jgi:thiosulfate/3-mercaptopyruvate sulfurtransferase
MDSGYAHPEVLVDVAWVAAHLDDPAVRLVEVDVSPATYNGGHIDGAVLWNAYTDLRSDGYRPVGAEKITSLLSHSGITPETTIVFYGYGGVLGFWLMKMYGHNDVRLLNGIRDLWSRAGHGWSTSVPAIEPSSYPQVREDHDLIASRDVVADDIGKNANLLLDVRARAEYEGEIFWPSGAPNETGRAGRLPGAVHLPVDSVRSDDGVYVGANALRGLFDEKGVTADRPIITYCTIGNRASQAWFVLKYLLGYPDVRVYYGSWVEWGMLPESAIEVGA